MKYYICEEVCNGDVAYVCSEVEAEKNDLVVFMEYNAPALARIVKEMDELEAITSDFTWFESLANVSVKKYYEKRKAELEKAKLIKLMKDQIELHSLEEKLKKNAEINPEMAGLFEKYKALSGQQWNRLDEFQSIFLLLL